jgi:hypothetical protein
LALNAACDLIAQHHTVQRIEGRNVVIIGREAVEQYCRDRKHAQPKEQQRDSQRGLPR